MPGRLRLMGGSDLAVVARRPGRALELPEQVRSQSRTSGTSRKASGLFRAA